MQIVIFKYLDPFLIKKEMKTDKTVFIIVIIVAVLGVLLSAELTGEFLSKISGKPTAVEYFPKDVYEIYNVLDLPEEQEVVESRSIGSTKIKDSAYPITPYYPPITVEPGQSCGDCTDRRLREEVTRLRERVRLLERQSSQCSQSCVDEEARNIIDRLEREERTSETAVCQDCSEAVTSRLNSCTAQHIDVRQEGGSCDDKCREVGKTCVGATEKAMTGRGRTLSLVTLTNVFEANCNEAKLPTRYYSDTDETYYYNLDCKCC